MLDKVKDRLAHTYEEFDCVSRCMDYDEGSYLSGYIAALEWVLEQVEKEEL